MTDARDYVLHFMLVWGTGTIVVVTVAVALFLYIRRQSLTDDARTDREHRGRT